MVLNKWPNYTVRVKKAMSIIIKQGQVVCSGILTVGIQGQSSALEPPHFSVKYLISLKYRQPSAPMPFPLTNLLSVSPATQSLAVPVSCSNLFIIILVCFCFRSSKPVTFFCLDEELANTTGSVRVNCQLWPSNIPNLTRQ